MDRILMSGTIRNQLSEHLAASAPAEDGAFALLHPFAGVTGQRLIVGELVLPNPDDWDRQAGDHLVPSPRYVSRAISAAIKASAGLLFIHSHPNSRHPAGLSEVDTDTFTRLATSLAPMLDGPVAAAVVHPSSWAAELWDGGKLVPVESIWASGVSLQPLHRVQHVVDVGELDVRQRDALGKVHDVLRGCVVGVIGASGNGSPVAEQLVRIGVREVVLIDHDVLDTSSNLRRVIGSTRSDLAATVAPAKVDVVGRHLDGLGLDTVVRRVRGDVRDPAVLRDLLDCDVVIGATDTHASRAILTQLPAALLLPIIDVGIRAASFDGELGGLWAEVRRLTPGSPCLWCAGVLNADQIRAEGLPPEMLERELAEGYLPGGFGEPAPSIMPLNGLAASLATSQLLALLSSSAEVAPAVFKIDAIHGDAYPVAVEADPGCPCRMPSGGAIVGLWPEEG